MLRRLPGDEIGEIVVRLERTDLMPGPRTDDLFRRLVAIACTATGDDVLRLNPGLRARIRHLCARGEANLEAAWAHRVAAHPASVQGFPYLDHYASLAAAEYIAIVQALGRSPRHLVFVGSGPLPLSVVMLHRLATEMSITCLDRDHRAVHSGRSVARALTGDGSRLRFTRCDAAGYDYSAADVVVVAALVGTTLRQKRALLARIAKSLDADALLAARSVPADGRQLLYLRIDPKGVPSGLHVLGEWAPPPQVINSVLLLTTGSR